MHILITAGGTREYIDPIRFIANASSGKMGYSLARAAIKSGHKVTLITCPTALRPPAGAKIIRAESGRELFRAVKQQFGKCNCLIMAAAVADYAPERTSKTKIKKKGKTLTIRLKPTADILKWAGRKKKKNQVTVGFAVEARDIRAGAERKLKDKKADMIVVNTPSAIGADMSSVEIKTAGGKWQRLAKNTKGVLAKKIVTVVEEIYRQIDGNS